MKTLDRNYVEAAIVSMPEDTFSFDDLRKKIPCDYNMLKDVLFAMLDDVDLGLEQIFAEDNKAMRFRRRDKV